MYKNVLKSLLALILIFNISGFSSSSHADDLDDNQPDNYVSVTAFVDKTDLVGGDIVRIGIEQTIYPKWHTYWLNPGDSGLPTSVEWNLPEGFSVSELEFPTPTKIPYDELTNYGYEGTSTSLQNLTIPNTIGAEPITITGTVNMLVCHDICIPESHPVEITLNADGSAEPEKIAAAQTHFAKNLDVPASYSVTGTDLQIEVTRTGDELNIQNAYLAPEEWGILDNNGVLTIEKNATGYVLKQKRGERDLSEIKEFAFVISDKDKTNAYRIVAKPSSEMATGTPIPLISNTVGSAPDNIVPVIKSTGVEFTFVKAIIFALLGGIILNLMPCVFPVLSMKALSLVQLSDKEESKARLYGLSYTAGILISFLLIAGILIALKSAGAQIGWGFQLQNPIVISVLIYLIFIIGLNLSGFFEIAGGAFGNFGQKLAGQSGNKGAFFTGVLATIVATPCTAPFMGAAMGYALTQPAYVSLIVFMALGFGLALPYLLLCFVPALRTKLPKPGAWMENFRQFLSFPMYLTAAFLIWVLSQQAGNISVLIILSAMIAITFVIWLWKHMPAKGILRGFSLALLAVSLLFFITAPFSLTAQETAPTAFVKKDAMVFSNKALNEALKTDKPVFTEMTADWCITCKVNERIAIKTKKVQRAFAENNIQYFQGDWTKSDPEITKYLNSFDRQGVPLYVFYGAPDAQTGKRPEPVILPQILTAGLVVKAVQ